MFVNIKTKIKIYVNVCGNQIFSLDIFEIKEANIMKKKKNTKI